jgi:light-regulated signal transduction histidine kinase (bacteriophytochrome)
MSLSEPAAVAADAFNAAAVDLTTCAREPIHIPGSIQPHGALFALDESNLTVVQASANVEAFVGLPHEAVLGRRVEDVLGPALAEQLRALASGGAMLDRNPLYLRAITPPAGGGPLNAIAHRAPGAVILELEPAGSEESTSFGQLYPLIRTFVSGLQNAQSVREICDLTAQEVRRITGFDRVLVYQFDRDWNGTVVGEARDPSMPPYFDLRFPASDIPAQARELYRLNRIRQIVDAGYRSVPVVPAANPGTGRPLDMSFASLRSVSPVHCEYLHNMGIVASFSISIMREGELWGLISCHHRSARAVSFEVRTACDFLGQVLSVQLSAREREAEYGYRMRLKETHGKLLAYMAQEERFADGLVKHADDLLALTDAAGAAVVYEGRVQLVGATPTEEQVGRVVAWLGERQGEEERDEVFCTESLPALLSGGEAMKETACGVLAVGISKLHRSYLLWFRPEVIQTVTWGGDPRKPAEPGPDGNGVRLHPRRSFEAWKETVRLRSLAWRSAEEEAARDLRAAVVGIVLRKAEEMAELNAELERSNKELEAFSYSVSHDLRAPFRHIVGYAELLRDRIENRGTPEEKDELRYIATIIESAQFAGKLVDNLLSFSQMGRATLTVTRVDLNALVEECKRTLEEELAGRAVEWRVGKLPTVQGDLIMLRLVVQNLLGNAVKYTAPRAAAVIEVEATEAGGAGGGEWVIRVSDNGVGFDMRYVDKLFGVFQRLHRVEEFEGTGIGLANVRRIVARHGGRTWAQGQVDQGATFFFTIPKAPQAGV